MPPQQLARDWLALLSVQRELAPAAIGALLDTCTPAECANDLSKSGYIKPNLITP